MSRTTGKSIKAPALASCWVLLATTLPLILWSYTEVPLPPGLLVPVLVMLAYSAGKIAGLVYRGEPRLITGIVWFFFYVTSGVVPLAQMSTGIYPHLMDKGTLVEAQIVALIAAGAFDASHFFLRARRRKDDGEPVVVNIRKARLVRESLLPWLVVVAFIGSAYYVRSLGGPGIFFQSRRELGNEFLAQGFRQGSQVGSALVVSVGTVPAIVAFILWTVRMIRRPERRTFGGGVVWVALLCLNGVVNNPITSARFWFLTVLIGLVYSLPGMTHRLYRFSLIGGIVTAIVVFPYTDYFRTPVAQRGPIQIGAISDTIASKDYDQFMMMGNGIWYVGAHGGHLWGNQILGAVLFWVPRQVWSGKATDTGVLVGNYLNAGTPNLSSPLWMEFWMDFGWPGVLIGFFLVGMLAFRLDSMFAELRRVDSRRMFVLQVMLPMVAGYTFILMRGPLLQSMARFAVVLGIFYLLRGPTLEAQERREADEIEARERKRERGITTGRWT